MAKVKTANSTPKDKSVTLIVVATDGAISQITAGNAMEALNIISDITQKGFQTASKSVPGTGVRFVQELKAWARGLEVAQVGQRVED